MNQISGLVGRPRSTVYGIVNWFGKTKTVLNKPLSGRPQKLTNSDNRFIVREIKKDQKTSAPKVTTDREKCDVYEYVGTVRNVWKQNGYHGRVARRMPCISVVNRKRQVDFAREHQSEPLE